MSDSTVVFPEGMEHLAKSVETLVKGIEKKREFVKRGRTPNWMGIEEQIADHVMEVEKSCNQVMLQSLNIDAPVVIISGIPHRRVGSCESPYYTMAGMVKVHHTLYREKGTHQGRTVDPVSARAGVIGDGWLPRTARAMAYQLQQGTSREAERVGQEQKRLPYSRASFERVGHLVGEHYVKNHAEIEEVLISEFNVPQEAQSVSVSIDRVSVAMEEHNPGVGFVVFEEFEDPKDAAIGNLLSTKTELTIVDVMSALRISRTSAWRLLRSLISQQRVEREGMGRATIYRVINGPVTKANSNSPAPKIPTTPPGDHVGTKFQLSRDQVKLAQYATEERTIAELMELVGRKNRTKFRKKYIDPLLEAGFLKMTIPEKPRSSNQKYIATPLHHEEE